LWASRPFDGPLVRRVAMLKAWTDQRASPRYAPEAFLEMIQPDRFRWTDLNGLVPRNQHAERDRICQVVRERFAFLEPLIPGSVNCSLTRPLTVSTASASSSSLRLAN